MEEQLETFKVKVTYSKFYKVKAKNSMDALNKAVNYYYSLANFFNECSADIMENESEDDKHKYQELD